MGIIGSADGPTSILVSTSLGANILPWVLLILGAGALAWLLIRKHRK